MRRILHFFDKAEDRIRQWLSRRPILYAFIAGVGVVIFWRGVWHLNDFLVALYSRRIPMDFGIDAVGLPWWDGPLSILIGGLILLLTGPFVSSFIGNEVIISGMRGEKKLAEKTELEVKTEMEKLNELEDKLDRAIRQLDKSE